MSQQHKDLPRITPDDQQPPLIGYITRLLNNGLDMLGGMHRLSWRHGYVQGYEAGKVATAQAPQKPSAVVVSLQITDKRDTSGRRPAMDRHIFDDAKLVISSEVKAQIRADAAARLPPERQPTQDQWKAILSPTLATCTVGIAGTGKTYVLSMRVILLHVYLGVPLEDITVLSFTKDCRSDVMALLADLFARWERPLTAEQAGELVKTPRGAVLSQARSLPDLAETVPFDALSETDTGDLEGRPFDARLTNKQVSVLADTYQRAYQADEAFAEAVRALFRSSSLLQALPVEHPTVQKRAPLAWAQEGIDRELTERVDGIWKAAGVWPLPGIRSEISPVVIRGRTFHFHGFIPELDAFVVLGYDRSEGKLATRKPGVKMELFKEVEIKRTMLQAYSPKPVIHLDSYEQAKQLSHAIEHLARKAPAFSCQLKGEPRAYPIVEAFYHAGTLMETLGLNVPAAVASMNFMADDPDAYFFQALAAFWPAFEAYLLEQKPATFTYNRLFLMFGAEGEANIKHLPDSVLQGMRHVLADEVQDLTAPIGEWIKACLIENRRRNLLAAANGVQRVPCTLSVAGDDFQTAHGSQGATARYLLDFEAEFRAHGSGRVILGQNFRSHQAIIDAAHAMVLGIPAVNGAAPVSVAESGRTAQEPVMVHDLETDLFLSVLNRHYERGDDVLILAANPEDFKLMEPAINSVLEKDKLNGANRRVRVRACQRAKGLEADAVLIVGDFIAPQSSWSKNQIYRRSSPHGSGDQSPFDTIQQYELYRLAHIGITRARRYCYWFIRKPDDGAPLQMRASIRIEHDGRFIKDMRT